MANYYFPRFWLEYFDPKTSKFKPDFEQNVFVFPKFKEDKLNGTIAPNLPVQPLLIQSETNTYELCSKTQSKRALSRIGIHNLYYDITFKGQCPAVRDGRSSFLFVLKRDRKNYYETDIGLNPFVLNEIATLYYLQSFTSLKTQNITELQQTFFDDQTVTISRIYTKYPVTLRKWRDEIGSDPLSFYDLYLIISQLLDILTLLKKFKIKHRGITPDNIFLIGFDETSSKLKKRIVLGGWSHALVEDGARNELKNLYHVDNLIFTGILQDEQTKDVDYVMLANTLYYLLYQKQPEHILSWNRQITDVTNEEMKKHVILQEKDKLLEELKKLSLSEALEFLSNKGEKQLLLYFLALQVDHLRNTKDVDWFPLLSVGGVNSSDFELQIVDLIHKLAKEKDAPIKLSGWRKTYKERFLELPEYKLEQAKLEAEQVRIPPTILDVIKQASEVERLKLFLNRDKIKDDYRLQREKEECKQLKEIGFLQKREDFSAQNNFLEIIEEVEKLHEELRSSLLFKKNVNLKQSMVCTANSLFQRFPNKKIPFKENFYVNIPPELLEQKKEMFPVEMIKFFYFTCVFITAKLHGYVFNPSHVQSWLFGFIYYISNGKKKSTTKLQDFVNSPLYSFLVRIIFQFERSICQSLRYIFFTETSRELFENTLCKALKDTNIDQSSLITTLIQDMNIPIQSFLAFDLQLLYPEDYDSSKTYPCKKVIEWANDLVNNRSATIEFLLELSKHVEIIFIDQSDGLQMFSETLLGEGTKSYVTDQNFNLSFRKPQSSIYFGRFYGGKPPPRKRKDIIIGPKQLAGHYLHEFFFTYINQKLEDKQSKLFKPQNILSFNMKLYVIMALKNLPPSRGVIHEGVEKNDLYADAVAWFSLIHGTGKYEVTVNVKCEKDISKSQLLDLLDYNENFAGGHLLKNGGIQFSDSTKDIENFEPNFETQESEEENSKEVPSMFLYLATNPDVLKTISPSFQLTADVEQEYNFANFLNNYTLYTDLFENPWKIHMKLFHDFFSEFEGQPFVFLAKNRNARSVMLDKSLKVEEFDAPFSLATLQQFRLKQLTSSETQQMSQRKLQQKCEKI